MILDYTFSKQDKRFEVSYITEKGQKSFLTFDNLSRFKTYYYTPAGEFDTYDGAKAGICYTDSPSKFDIKEYLTELPDQYKSLISQKTYPKLYTFDIETKISETGEFPDPAIAKQEITTISVVSPDLNAIVFGTKPLSQEELAYCEKSFKEYVEANEFFQTLKKPTPTFQYILCDNEKEMLRLFLTRIVAKVSILAGWNSILFDWQYIVNRIKNNYPMLSLKLASCTKQLTKKRFTSRLGDKIDLPMPVHTLILDMMDIIKDDITIMPIKESLGLDYIASESVKANKIKYDGTLQDLYNNDYKNYVFYNCIDSVLVQLIDYRFRCLELYYQYALYCNEKIGNCFSPIALTESLVFKDFYENGVKIVYQKAETPERTPLIGAYVKVPIPGKYKFICCNDFASLYPSTIITCNISFENYVGAFYDEEKLEYFRKQEGKYLIIGGQVYKNDGKPNKPSIGEFVGNFIDEKRLEKYKKDKNYFVSVNGHVYRNDKEYTFKRIQRKLKAERNIDKYLGKKIEAEVVTDIRHLIKGANEKLHTYEQDIIESLEQLGYKGYSCGEDFRKLSVEELKDAERIIYAECKFKESHQMAMKLLGNSMYGGCSHVAFYFYNMNLANDITGEARNVIHMMEHHIPKYFEDNWFDMVEHHKKWGIEVDQSLRGKVKNLCIPIYGDSCDGETVISLKDRKVKIKDLFDESEKFYKDRGKEFALSNEEILNFDGNTIVTNKIKYVIRHNTSKGKWKICVNGNEVIVTEDHSLIVINKTMKEIKPSKVKVGDLMMTLDGLKPVESIERIGEFQNEYVYDIEVETEDKDMHNFFGNGILIHNTDSVQKDTIIRTDKGTMTIEELYNSCDSATMVTQKGHELVKSDKKILNYNDKDLEYVPINYVMRHKVRKPKWKLKTKSGKEIIVTNDHSMIVFRDGKKLEVKPKDILRTDKILCIKEL